MQCFQCFHASNAILPPEILPSSLFHLHHSWWQYASLSCCVQSKCCVAGIVTAENFILNHSRHQMFSWTFSNKNAFWLLIPSCGHVIGKTSLGSRTRAWIDLSPSCKGITRRQTAYIHFTYGYIRIYVHTYIRMYSSQTRPPPFSAAMLTYDHVAAPGIIRNHLLSDPGKPGSDLCLRSRMSLSLSKRFLASQRSWSDTRHLLTHWLLAQT